ncbi:hypothetical protein D3C76_757970 [compost metagenome]
MAGVGVDVVAAKAGFHQLVGGVAFPHGPLAGTEHADRFRAFAFECFLVFLRHDVEGLVPRDRLELALLVVLAVAHAQQRLGQAIDAVHDLRQEVALDAVEATIDFGLDVAMRGHHAVVPRRHHHAATGPAESARRLVPVQGDHLRFGHQVAGGAEDRQAGCRRGNGSGLGLGEFPTCHAHCGSPARSRYSW